MQVAERPRGVFSRQLFLGDTLDTEHIAASYDAGVLTLRIPVAEQAKPRKISITNADTDTADQRLTSQASDEEISVAAACSVLEHLEPGRLDERALDDVWADPELLAIEFEAIVSANYPTSADRARPSAAGREFSSRRAGHPHRTRSIVGRAHRRPRDVDPLGDERSPGSGDRPRRRPHLVLRPQGRRSSSDGIDRTRRCFAANAPRQTFGRPPAPRS